MTSHVVVMLILQVERSTHLQLVIQDVFSSDAVNLTAMLLATFDRNLQHHLQAVASGDSISINQRRKIMSITQGQQKSN